MKRKMAIFSALLTVIVLFWIVPTLALSHGLVQAQSQSRTFVVPDDYGKISQAILHANNGDTVYVKTGNYSEGPLFVNKTISLMGENKDTTRVSINTQGHEVTESIIFHYTWYETALTVTADGFKLSGFSVTTNGGNIQANSTRAIIAGNCIAADVDAIGLSMKVTDNSLWTDSNNGLTVTGDFCNVSANKISGSLTVSGENNLIESNQVQSNMYVYSNESLVRNNILRDSYGMFTIGGNNNIISRNTLDHLGFGPKLEGKGNKFLLNNITRCGIAISPGTGNIIYANYFSKNAWILDSVFPYTQVNDKSVIFHNNFIDNHNYKVGGGSLDTADCLLDDGRQGNYWSDYRGTDSNIDGVGDTAYVFDENHSDHYPLMAPFDFSSTPESTPNWLAAPKVELIEPQNSSYLDANLTVVFTTNRQAQSYYFSVDGKELVSVAGNTSISDLTVGQHNITVYASDNFGNLQPSRTVNFAIETSYLVVDSSTEVLIAIIAIGAIASVSLVYFKRRRGKP
jgi:nitrous oxidase accessory protein NosD